jgi:uncharacterized protein DUF6221
VTAELTRFLNDRYDAIEALADSAAQGHPRWTSDSLRWSDEVNDFVLVDDPDDGGVVEVDTQEVVVYNEGRPDHDQSKHIAYNDPAAVIADLGSKRRIVNLLSPTWVSHCLDDCDICSVGRELAEPFADVDGWREDWRPIREGELLA